MNELTLETIRAAHVRIKPYIHRTPVLSSSILNKKLGAEIFFKCENMQKVGAFKARGACNAIMSLTDEQEAVSDESTPRDRRRQFIDRAADDHRLQQRKRRRPDHAERAEGQRRLVSDEVVEEAAEWGHEGKC